MLIKIMVIIFLVAIIVCLGFGLFYLYKAKSNKLLASLKFRVLFSVIVMTIITVVWLLGIITPQAPWLFR
jgi:phosphoglycerol transferase MdoB-like AlkP superfamily enzyme